MIAGLLIAHPERFPQLLKATALAKQGVTLEYLCRAKLEDLNIHVTWLGTLPR